MGRGRSLRGPWHPTGPAGNSPRQLSILEVSVLGSRGGIESGLLLSDPSLSGTHSGHLMALAKNKS